MNVCVLCMYVCVHACFVDKMKSTDIVPYNGLSSRGANFTNGPMSCENLCWAVSKVRLWILRCVECKKCRPMIRSLFLDYFSKKFTKEN